MFNNFGGGKGWGNGVPSTLILCGFLNDIIHVYSSNAETDKPPWIKTVITVGSFDYCDHLLKILKS